VFTGPLPSNALAIHVTVLPSEGCSSQITYWRSTAPFFWGFCSWCHVPVAQFLRGDHSPTAISVPSLWALVPSSSLLRCQPVQVYYHHPRPMVPLDPVYHIIYLGDYLLWAFPQGLKLWRFPLCAGWAIEPHFVALVVTCGVGWFDILSFHWPASSVGRHNDGCHVDGPRSLPHDRLWVAPCLEVLQTVGRRVIAVLAQTLG
jgi:hypothetical protein